MAQMAIDSTSLATNSQQSLHVLVTFVVVTLPYILLTRHSTSCSINPPYNVHLPLCPIYPQYQLYPVCSMNSPYNVHPTPIYCQYQLHPFCSINPPYIIHPIPSPIYHQYQLHPICSINPPYNVHPTPMTYLPSISTPPICSINSSYSVHPTPMSTLPFLFLKMIHIMLSQPYVLFTPLVSPHLIAPGNCALVTRNVEMRLL